MRPVLGYGNPTDAPLLIANGTNEGIPFPQAQEMAAAYQRNGIPYQLLHAPQQAHSEHLGQFIYPQTFAFLDRYVKGYRPGSPPPSTSPSASVPPITPDPGSPGGSGTPAGCAQHPRRCHDAPGSSNTVTYLVLGGVAALLASGGVAFLLLRHRPTAGR